MASAHSTTCLLLDSLPTELRLSIYEHLLISDSPLQGKDARNGKSTGLDLTILRTNRQIHEEAKMIFYGKNTFLVTSIPGQRLPYDDSRTGEVDEKHAGRFDPPLLPHHLPLLRHLTFDLLCLPSVPVFEAGLASWKSADPGAAAYVRSMVQILQNTTPRSLRLTARPPHPFDAKSCLLSFSAADRNSAFASALACLPLTAIGVSFEFPDCYYRTTLLPSACKDQSILLLASQVIFCQSQVRIQQMMREFDGVEAEVEARVFGVHEDVVMRKGWEVQQEEQGQSERVDLDPLVAAWPHSVAQLGDVVRRARHVERDARWLERMH